MIVGCARVSKGDLNLDLQLDALSTHECEKILTDKISVAKEKKIAFRTKSLSTKYKIKFLYFFRLFQYLHHLL
jgi:hypothetical protein